MLSPTKTRVLSVEFSSRDPDIAARGANAVVDAYIEMQRDAKRDSARVAARSLATLVADLKNRVAAAEAEADAFRSKSGLLVGSNNAIITTQQLGDLNTQLSASRAAQADAQAKARILREMLRQGRIGEIPDVANNELIRRITEQRVAVRAQLALESRTLLPAHPRIKELTAQLVDIDAQWRAAAERTARTLENEARIAGSRVENLARALDEQKRAAGDAGAEEVRLHELERAAKLLKEQLEVETAKYQEALAREGVKATPADARVIQRALAPQLPSFPKKIPITIFSAIAALLLSVGWIVAGELLSGRARATPPLAANSNDALPVEAPPLAAQAPAEETPQAAASQSAGAATGVDLAAEPPAEQAAARTDDGAARVVCAPEKIGPSVKTLVAICDDGARLDGALSIGRGLSRRGRAVLVGADPGAAGLESVIRDRDGPAKGLGELMAGAADFGQIIHRDGKSRLHIVPDGAAGVGERYDLSLVVEALAGAYDFVVFATRSTARARELAPYFEVTLVQGGANAEALRAELRAAGLNASLVDDSGEARSAA